MKGKHHILDTLAAIVSGAALPPGQIAIKYAKAQGGTEEAQVVTTSYLTTAVNAAMANGFLAHSDETDDSHAASGTHPGCSIVPAALAMAERANVCGERLLNAVVLGYDMCARAMFSLGERYMLEEDVDEVVKQAADRYDYFLGDGPSTSSPTSRGQAR